MKSILLYLGIVLIVVGWGALAYFAGKSVAANRDAERMPQRLAEVRHKYLIKRTVSRCAVIAGLIMVIIYISA